MEYQIVTKTGTIIKQFGSLFLAKEYVHSWVNNRAGKLTSQGGWVIRDTEGRMYDTSDFVTSVRKKRVRKKVK